MRCPLPQVSMPSIARTPVDSGYGDAWPRDRIRGTTVDRHAPEQRRLRTTVERHAVRVDNATQ